MAKAVKSTAKKSTTEAGLAGVPTVSRKAKSVMPTEEQIRARAYEIYRRRNGAPGDAAADWKQAERELREELAN